MGNPLLNRQQPQIPTQPQQASSLRQQIQQLRQQGPSNVLFNQMYNSNPQFREFADKVRNMTPEEAFRQNGLDFNQFRDLKW